MNYFTGSDFLPRLDEQVFGLRHPEEIQIHIEDPNENDEVDDLVLSDYMSSTAKPFKKFSNSFGLEDILEVDEHSALWSEPSEEHDIRSLSSEEHYPSLYCRGRFYDGHSNGSISPTLPMFCPHGTTKLRTRARKSGRSWLRSTSSFLINNTCLSHSRALWLTLYFVFNLLLTLSNKSVLMSFPFPYSLTALHALICSVGGCFLRSNGFFSPKPLKFRQEIVLAAFSVLYAVNIAVSNVSLNMVTVPFHQVVRAVTPVFTIILSAILLDARTARMKMTSLAPVILGVVLATYGDYYFTPWGLFLTLLGTLLAALKTIYTNILQSSTHATPASPILLKSIPRLFDLRRHLMPPSLGLHSLDLLTRMSPLAFIQCVIYAQVSGELDRLRYFGRSYGHDGFHATSSFAANITQTSMSPLTPPFECAGTSSDGLGWSHIFVLLINGVVAFGLNIVSFTANGKVGALSMTVAANIKQVLTILVAVSMFNLTITPINAIGILLTLLGGAWYAAVEYSEKKPRQIRR